MTDLVQKIADAVEVALGDDGHSVVYKNAAVKEAIRQALADTGGAVAWQFYQDGKWWSGDDDVVVLPRRSHRENTEAAGIPTRDLYAHPDSGRVAELEAQLAHVTALHRNAAQTLDGVLETRRSVERELAESRNREGRMRVYGEQLLDAIDEPPDAHCSCHLSPPCSDCVDYGYLREAIRDFKAALAADKEKNGE